MLKKWDSEHMTDAEFIAACRQIEDNANVGALAIVAGMGTLLLICLSVLTLF